MSDKIMLLYFMFGCWTKYVPGFVGFLGYNIWFVLALFWIIINALGVFNFLFNQNAGTKAFIERLDTPMENKWIVYNLITFISFCTAECWGMAIAFALTSGLFMALIISDKRNADKNKNNN